VTLLLTGATGFIGSFFKHAYSHTYTIETFSFLHDNFEHLNLDGIETIVHLSALVHQMNGADPKDYEEVNRVQTLNLAKKAKESGVRHFVFMSTVKVYGEESDTVYIETAPCHPKDPYGISKYHAEQELQKVEDETFTLSIIRTPIVYGYGVKANIKNLISLVQTFSLLPFGNISNKRSIVYIGNLSHLITCIIEQRKGGIFLASDDEPLSTTLFIQLIAKALNKKITLIQIPFFESLLRFVKSSFHKRLYQSLEVDNTLTKKILNFKNPYTTEEGIQKMIQGEHP
jgi:UDP-glucose 4-epimerase